MPERTEYEPGTPSWVDLSSPDLDESARFYGALFGWEAAEVGDPEQTGGYRMFRLHGKDVAGLGPLQEGSGPPHWMTYVTVADAGETMEKVRGAGGQVLLEPMQVLDAGSMAVYRDTVGAVAAVWQPGRSIGAQLVNDPGTLTSTELATREIEPAREFYREVFGWDGETGDAGGVTYTQWKLGDRLIGGMIQMDDAWPDEIPSHWMNYFAVEDADAAAEKADAEGGTVHVPPTDIVVGRFAVVTDPQGAAFSVIKLAQPAD
jgi:predicted enzyme related to lactoylglutathione lyase